MRICLIILFSITHFALAKEGGAGSHGGDVVVCFKGTNKLALAEEAKKLLKKKINPFDEETLALVDSVRLLDFVEYQIPQNFKKKGRDFFLDHILNKLDKVAHPHSSLIRRVRERSVVFKNYSALPALSDEGMLPNMMKGCLLVQIAIQKPFGVIDYNDGRIKTKVLIYKELFEKLSDFDQAGLYLHEYLYHIAIYKADKTKHPNSEKVRSMNAYLFSNSLENSKAVLREFEDNGLHRKNWEYREYHFMGRDRPSLYFRYDDRLNEQILFMDSIDLGYFKTKKREALFYDYKSRQLRITLLGDRVVKTKQSQMTLQSTSSVYFSGFMQDKLKISGIRFYQPYSYQEHTVLEILEFDQDDFPVLVKLQSQKVVRLNREGKIVNRLP